MNRVTGAVLRHRGRVLLGHRSRDRKAYPGVWDIPGGHVDENESPEQALVRELGEELGIEPHIPPGGPWVTLQAESVELTIFIVDRWLGEPWNRAPHEHDELRWVSLAELPDLELAHPSYVDLLTRAMDVQLA